MQAAGGVSENVIVTQTRFKSRQGGPIVRGPTRNVLERHPDTEFERGRGVCRRDIAPAQR